MTLKGNIKIICCVLCWWLPTGSWAQVNFSKADSFRKAKNYERAAIEYDRAGFFAENETAKATALIKKADCYMQSGDYASAAFNLTHLNYSNISDSLVFEAHLLHALSSYLNNDLETALEQLDRIQFTVHNPALINQSLYLKVLTLNELNRYKEAHQVLLDWINHSDQLNKQEALQWANDFYSSKHIPKLLNMDRAVLLSMIPGFGHFYCHEYKEGVVNAALQLGFLAFGAGAFYYGYYATAFVIGYGLFNKFHSGANHRMEFLVNKRNYNLTRPFNDEARAKVMSWNH